MLAAILWVQQASPPADALADLAKQGVLGILATLLFWFAWQAYKRERDAADEARAELRESRARELLLAEKVGSETTLLLSQATVALERVARRRST